MRDLLDAANLFAAGRAHFVDDRLFLIKKINLVIEKEVMQSEPIKVSIKKS